MLSYIVLNLRIQPQEVLYESAHLRYFVPCRVLGTLWRVHSAPSRVHPEELNARSVRSVRSVQAVRKREPSSRGRQALPGHRELRYGGWRLTPDPSRLEPVHCVDGFFFLLKYAIFAIYISNMKHVFAFAAVMLLGAGCVSGQNREQITPAAVSQIEGTQSASGTSMLDVAQKVASTTKAIPSKTITKVQSSAAILHITITDSAFAPQILAVNVGDTVVWTNKGTMDHNAGATSLAVLWDSGNIKPGESFSHTFTSPGSYMYRSTGKISFEGRIIVYEKKK